MGFSKHIQHHAYQHYLTKTKTYSYVFSGIMALISAILFPLYGKWTGEISWPWSLLFGLGMGAIFISIAFFGSLFRKRISTWDGVVLDKSITRKASSVEGEILRLEYVLLVKRDDGKIFKHIYRDDDTLFNYYEVGDRVRRHNGFSIYEKYDKTKDDCIFCIACGTINDICGMICERCRCPLLV